MSTVAVVSNRPCLSEPKIPESRRVVHLDGPVLAALRGQRKRQAAEQLSPGPGWRESGLVFTSVIGGMLDAHNVRRTFDLAIAKAGLPPIRLHDYPDLRVIPTSVCGPLGHKVIGPFVSA